MKLDGYFRGVLSAIPASVSLKSLPLKNLLPTQPIADSRLTSCG